MATHPTRDDMHEPPELSTHSTSELFSLYSTILQELRSRGVVRTNNAPAGDYAEYLVTVAFGGQLAANSEKSWDVLLPDGRRLQVKCRVVSDKTARNAQLSVIRSFDFDELVIVLLSDTDYAVRRAVMVPSAVAETAGAYRSHVNGRVLIANSSLLDSEGAVDCTVAVKAAALANIQSIESVAQALDEKSGSDCEPAADAVVEQPVLGV